jgi:hypothetical protein
MRPSPALADHGRDVGTRTAHLQLDLDLDDEPISGRIAVDGDEPVAFTGYTGLIATLESIREGELEDVPS